MAVWRDGVSLTVEIAFATDPLATTPTWVDVTDYVRDIPSVTRGRRSQYTDFPPGSCQVVLDNRDRRFDPDYSAGAYDPDVTPMRKLKITWAFAAASGLVFTGFVLGWPQQENVANTDGFVTITAVDGSRFFQNSPLASSSYADAVEGDSPRAYWKLQSDGDETISDVDLVVQSGLFGTDIDVPAGDDKSFSGGNLEVTLPSGWLTTYPKTMTWWSQAELSVGTDIEIIYVESLDFELRAVGSGGEMTVTYHNNIGNPEVVAADDGAAHHWAVTWDTASAGTMRLYRDGVEVDTVALSGDDSLRSYSAVQVFASTSSSVSHLATWTTELSAATILSHYQAGVELAGVELAGARVERVLDEIGWPSGQRSVDAGDTYQDVYLPAGQRAMEYLRAVERSEQGLLFFDVDGDLRFIGRNERWTSASVATFSDDGNVGDLVYRNAVRGSFHDTIRNVVTCSYSTVGAITRKSNASITAYTESRESIDAPTIPNARTASTLAAYVLRENKDPKTRIEQLTVPLRIDGGDNEAEKLLALEIGDKITFERTPLGVGSQVVKTLLVQGIHHRISLNQWVVTLYTSPQESNTTAPYLTMGDATYGKIGNAAGNLVPF